MFVNFFALYFYWLRSAEKVAYKRFALIGLYI